MKSFDQMVFLSGLPRTGSTLLSSILEQNPLIHAEGNSALCTLMWDTQESCQSGAQQMLMANRRWTFQDDLVSHLPHFYYKDAKRPIIVDKCRSWTIPANLEMIERYITKTPKIIVMERPLDEILASFSRVRKENGFDGKTDDLLVPMSEPIMRSQYGIDFAKRSKAPWFLFLTYKELTEDTENTLSRIYEFCEWEYFTHDLNNIVTRNPEDDAVYDLIGLHDIRPTISPRVKA